MGIGVTRLTAGARWAILEIMAATGTTTKTPSKKRPAKRLSNAQLLKLAAKRRPPQSWYDQTIDPTKPAPKSGHWR